MDRLKAIETFVRVVERESFKRAAEDLGIANGSASQLVQGLERHLGVRLLRRTTRRLALTDEGRSYLERCRRILADLAEADETVAGAAGSARGKLRVQAPVGFAIEVLAPALGRFLRDHPKVEIELISRDRFPDFVDERVDVALYVGTVPERGVVVRRLAEFALPICAAPRYLEEFGNPRAPSDLERHNCINILSTETGRPLDWRFQRHSKTSLVPVAGNLNCEASEAAVAAALGGAGLLQMISYLVADHLASGALRQVMRDWTWSGPTMSVVYPQQRYMPAKLRAFVDFTVALLRERTGRATRPRD